MAYQNVATPRFYVDILLWHSAIGLGYPDDPDKDTVFDLNPQHLSTLNNGNHSERTFRFKVDGGYSPDKLQINYFALLGHGLRQPPWDGNQHYTVNGRFYKSDLSGGDLYLSNMSLTRGINLEKYDANLRWQAKYRGVSMGIFDAPSDGYYEISNIDKFFVNTGKAVRMGAFSIGRYFDMPRSPNLSLKINREYGGTKEVTTYNGSSISNTMWSAPPKWGNLPQWTVRGSDEPLANFTSGRRSWDLSFSYIDQSNMFAPTESNASYIYDTIPYTDDTDLWDSTETADYWNHNQRWLQHEDFFTQVWHKTLGGSLRFIFQPDNTNFNLDQFAICMFKENSLKVTRTAFNVYDISLSVEEVW